jgi:hypothetical protein
MVLPTLRVVLVVNVKVETPAVEVSDVLEPMVPIRGILLVTPWS